MIAVMAPLPRNSRVIWIADVDVIKEIVSQRNRYPKLPDMYNPLRLYGEVGHTSV